MSDAPPDWLVFPEAEWQTCTPAQAGFRQPDFNRTIAAHEPRPSTFWGERHAPDDFGAALTRGGYLVHTWGRADDYRYQTASVGKAFTRAALGLAVEKLGLNSDEPVCRTWTGAGQLSHPHKHLDNEAHRDITWRHLVDHEAGFGIENACHWREGQLPDEDWIRAQWTGDPLFDMYALRPPAKRYYSSAGYVRLGQALTALWDMDLKPLLDRELFSRMGLPPERWQWLTLAEARAARDMYPATPGYADYVDPPYEINGHAVRGGPGWVVMSALDLCRFGLLVATGGWWKGERLLGAEWLISKSGGNHSTVVGDRQSFVAGARVATEGLPDFLWVPDFVEYRFPSGLLDPGRTPGGPECHRG
ncbi:MAG: serine hydrolase [Armatimonadetes bacterium]|nr:serine hydrolase [Armatimonadota bacterium]